MREQIGQRFQKLWQRRRTLYEAVVFVVVAAGATLVASALLEPQWSVLLFLDHVPGLVMGTISWLKVRPKTAIALYGGVLTVGALGVFAVTERGARAGLERYEELREPIRLRLLVLAGFVGGFVGARAVVVLGGLADTASAQPGSGLVQQIWLFGYHIHHFFIGFLLLVVAGWGALLRPEVSRRWLAALYGVGVGVFVDEFGFLLTWGDYYARQSWFVAVTFLSVLLIAMLWTWGTAERDEPPLG